MLDALQKEWELHQRQNQELLDLKSQKIEKLYRCLSFKAEKDLLATRAKLSELQRSDRPEDKKILPAWEGRVREAERRLNELAERKRKDLKELEERKEFKESWNLLNIAFIEFVSAN